MNRTIQYAIHQGEGTIISRVGREVAWPVIDFAAFGKDGDFTGPIPSHLEKVSVLDVGREWKLLRWTRKVPTTAKNEHRAFWGFPLLKGELA